MNKMSIFAETLAVGGTIYSKTKARITGDKVGAENYARWTSALQKAHRNFYEYKRAVDNSIRGRKVDLKTATDNAYDALQAILDLIGEVNGFKLEKSAELLDEVSKYAVAEKVALIGEALTIKSRIDCIKAELKTVGYDKDTGKYNNGVNPEFVETRVEEWNTLDEELKLAKKSADSGRPYDDLASYNTFVPNFERKIAKLTNDQSMKSYEEIAAEREAKRKERRAKTAASKKAKAQANK